MKNAFPKETIPYITALIAEAEKHVIPDGPEPSFFDYNRRLLEKVQELHIKYSAIKSEDELADDFVTLQTSELAKYSTDPAMMAYKDGLKKGFLFVFNGLIDVLTDRGFKNVKEQFTKDVDVYMKGYK
jgi:hypothetical protein